MDIDVVILAAGQGTRMHSKLPKVLHKLAGKTLLQRVCDVAAQLNKAQFTLVVGHGVDQVKDSLSIGSLHQPPNWTVQEQQLGTGHAVLQALQHLRENSIVLILYGDVPLINIETLHELTAQAEKTAIAMLTVELEDPTGYGRILRDSNNAVVANIEHKDASEEQHQIKEINTGILAVRSTLLKKWIPKLSNDNAQGEYYLTDIIAMAALEGLTIATASPQHQQEVEGINDREQLSRLERWFQQYQGKKLMAAGVTLIDPDRFDLRGELTIGMDVVIDINVVIQGKVSIGDNVTIGPNCIISDCEIADDVIIQANSVLEESTVAKGCVIGPFARLRPGTELLESAKVGNFVETKKSIIGCGSKVNHLTYIGDAEIGENVNIGAGTITCNYDGVNKHKTRIKNGVFIGSNTSLVAPVSIGENATVGAGSTVTKDVSDHQLAVARGKQKNMDGWLRPTKTSK